MKQIAAEQMGQKVVVATVAEDLAGNPSSYAQCSQPGCPVSIQRASSGDLRDGVLLHYRTVHPEKGIR